MDKKKLLSAAAVTAICFAAASAAGTSPGAFPGMIWGAARQTAFIAAGIRVSESRSPQLAGLSQQSPAARESQPEYTAECTEASPEPEASTETEEPQLFTVELPEITSDITAEAPAPAARVITQNVTEFDDGIDRTAAGNKSGVIIRKHYGGYQGDDYINLPGGGMVWNCTADSAEKLISAAGELPDIQIEADSPEPQVLIVHTHTTESYEPYQRSYYDSSYPFRTRDPSCNMIRVGDELAQKLAERGISVLHDGTIHDYPAYTGAYDRSETTIRAALEEYPSIKVIIDLHRDAIASADGSRTAPVAEIDGRNAAQFMIISGCDDGRFGNMPEYLENFRLACLIQQSAEKRYPGLARPILFDYRNYNQHISTGSLLIEVGSHANSLDEAVYTGELLGECLSDALSELSAEKSEIS